jgi:serine/threonine-protein kinase
MSPEQVKGEPVGPFSDLYSLGCVIYAMAAGEPPFPIGTPAGIAWRQLHQEPVPLARRCPDIPPAIDSVVSVLLNKTPETRPANAGIVAQWLSQIPLTTQPDGVADMGSPCGDTATARGGDILWGSTQPVGGNGSHAR